MSVSNAKKASGTPVTYANHDLHDFKRSYNIGDADSIASSDTLAPTDLASLSGSSSPTSASYAVGTAPEDFYVRTLSPWRAAARQFVIRHLQAESNLIAKIQARIRSPLLDTYFVYTSSLGTHTFFMTALPALFFFGYLEVGRGLVFVLAMGVYLSSFIKDLICAPRPYAPPVTRLTIGSHHLEYGFPSTHSTNSVSIALYIYSLIHTQYFTGAAISTLTYSLSCIFLSIYAVSIVFGRLYTGMHSFTDCAVGVTLGTGIWAAHALWWVPIEAWLVGASPVSWLPNWAAPVTISLLCGLMVHRHPQPADDCPCFEDAIAFVSVVAGVLIARWASILSGFDDDQIVSRMAGHAWPFSSSSGGLWQTAALWWAMALLKLTLGIALIFAWRLAAKFMLHSLLPPLFRWISYGVLPRLVSINILPKGAELPNRRFYTPATEYDGAVPEGGLHPIPSVIDLPAMLQERSKQSHYELDGELGGMKRRTGKGKGKKHSGDFGHVKFESEKNGVARGGSIYGHMAIASEESASEEGEDVKHYDADVLTKVVVYAGIGALATGLIPIMFEILGWGVHP